MLRLFEGGVYLKVGRDQELFTYDIVIFRIKLTELTSFDSDYSQQGQGAYQRFFFSHVALIRVNTVIIRCFFSLVQLMIILNQW